MSSVELFALAHQQRRAAENLRARARELARAVDDVQHSPGDATNSLGHESWAGAKATATERLMHDAYDLLNYAASQTAADIEDLEYQARQLDNQAEQTESQARAAARAEAEAEAEAEAARQRATQAATAAKTFQAAAQTAAQTSNPPAPTPPVTPPLLVYAAIETLPAVTPLPSNIAPEPNDEVTDFLY